MIDRDTVLHVARLARLDVPEDDVGPMAEELSTVLGHIEAIGRLDLEGVEPTAHVIVADAPGRPDTVRPSLDRDVLLEQAPDQDGEGVRVPSPQA